MARKGKSVAPADGASADAILAPLNSQVGYVLRRAQLAVFRDFVQRMAPLQLRPTHFAILTLAEATPGLTQIQVCEMLDIKRPNLVRLIDELERRNLVIRGKDSSDRRSYALKITEEGRRILAAAQPIHDAHERWIDEQLFPAGKGALLELTSKLALRSPPAAEIGDDDE
jgi:DNA-binding MarR family transcriptional regulator